MNFNSQLRRGTVRAIVVLSAVLVAIAIAAEEPPRPAAQERAYLGVYLRDAVDGGVEIVALVAGGSAARAGVRVGDVIVQVDARDIDRVEALERAMAGRKPGDSLRLDVLRGQGSQTLSVTLGTRRRETPGPSVFSTPRPAPVSVTVPKPDEVAVAPKFPRVAATPLQSLLRPRGLGLGVAEITPALRRHYGAPADAGVLVTSVADAAADAGFRIGDVLVLAGGQSIRSRPQLESVFWTWNWQQPVTVDVVRGGETLPLKLAAIRGSGDVPNDRALALRIRALELERKALEQRLRRIVGELEELTGDR